VEKGLELCSTPDVPTHRNGHTLDLVWANFPGPETRVAYEMDPGSDHLPLITELDAGRHSGGHRVSRSPEDTEEYAEVVGAMVGQWAPEAPRSIGDLDALAEGIIGTLQSALTEKPTSGIRPAPWWKGPVKEAYQQYKRTESEEDKLAWHKEIRIAKRNFWRKKIEEAHRVTDAFALARWAGKTQHKSSPPLKREDGSKAITPKDKAEHFLKTLLNKAKRPIPGEVPLLDPTQPNPSALLSNIFPEEEIRDALLGVSTTAPGEDNITTDYLRTA